MLNQYEPTVKAAITYLKLLGVKVNNGTVDETLRNHPEWPSLLCLSDSLNKWNIPNGAGEIDKKDINELPVPFIAYTNDIDTPLYIITEVTETTVQIFKQEYNKIITESKEAFMKMWNGVYLITEPNENSGEVNYELNKRTERLNSIIPIATFIALLLFSVLSLERIIGISFMFSVFNTTGVYLQFCISVLGIIVTSLLLWNEIDMNNPVLQKVCGRIRKGNCNAILTSKEAKLFSWLSWSEIGFSYFVGSLLILLFADESVANSIKLLFWINVLALPYTIFSIYYQWQVAKQWCLLCVATQILLILSAVNLMSSGFAFSFPLLSIGFVLKVSFYYLLPVLIWYAVKPYILSLQTAKSIRREYLRIKFNTEIYDMLLKKQKKITVSTEGLGIDIGNPSSNNTITKVCNPYCSHCAEAHRRIDLLLQGNSDLKIKIIFNSENSPEDISVYPVKHLLTIAGQQDGFLLKQALDDWYLPENKDYEQFRNKYPLESDFKPQATRISEMANWCQQMDITFTPTFFVNGYQLPDAYSIEDLQYLLLE